MNRGLNIMGHAGDKVTERARPVRWFIGHKTVEQPV